MKEVKIIIAMMFVFATSIYPQWTSPISITPDSGNYHNPVFAVKLDDDPFFWNDTIDYLAFCKTDSGRSSVYFSKSLDISSMWSNPVRLLSDPSANYDSPAMAVKGDTLLMVYRRLTGTAMELHAAEYNNGLWSYKGAFATDNALLADPYVIPRDSGFAAVWVQRGVIRFATYSAGVWSASIAISQEEDSSGSLPRITEAALGFNDRLTVVWQKQKPTDTAFALMYRHHVNNVWRAPDTLVWSGDNRNPMLIQRPFNGSSWLTYESDYYGNWKILSAECNDTTWLYTRDSLYYNMNGIHTQASFTSSQIIVKSSDKLFPYHIAGCFRNVTGDTDYIVLIPDMNLVQIAPDAIDRNPIISTGVYHESDIRVWVAWESNTGGHWGIYAVRNDIVLDINENGYLKHFFNLKQNYPNPFNPSTTIRYELPENGKVSLKIYNILGQEVRTLVNGYESAGIKQVQWDGKDNRGGAVASGVYLYKIQAGKFIQTRKMLMLK